MPGHCICPTENYTCMVKSAINIAWRTNTTLRMDFALSASDDDDELYYSEEGGFQVTTRQEGGTDVGLSNFTSSLHVRDLYYLQYLLCTHVVGVGFERVTTKTTVCVVGN